MFLFILVPLENETNMNAKCMSVCLLGSLTFIVGVFVFSFSLTSLGRDELVIL